MEMMKAMAYRQSCRTFTDEQLTNIQLQTILQAANAAPVAFGRYDELHLTVVQSPDVLEKIDATGFERTGIQKLMRYDAPTLIIVSFEADGSIPDFLKKMFSTESFGTYQYANAACVVENMILAATSLELGAVYLTGTSVIIAENKELLCELNVPKGFRPGAVLAVGNPRQSLIPRELTTSKIMTSYF